MTRISRERIFRHQSPSYQRLMRESDVVSFTVDKLCQQIKQKEGDPESKLCSTIATNKLVFNDQVDTNHCPSMALNLAEQLSTLHIAATDEKQSKANKVI